MSTIFKAHCKDWNITETGRSKEECERKIGCGMDMLTFEEIDEQDFILEQVPEEFRRVLYSIAWEDGHAYGESEVLNILKGLVYDLKPAIEAYTKRIINKN